MANTYTQIHVHTIFAVQNRQSLIQPAWKDEMYKYITGIIQHYTHKMIIINGMPDHLHILFGLRPIQCLSDLMREVKSETTSWINKRKFIPGKFSWQEGYGAFSYSKSQLPDVINYIKNQELHHQKKSFRQEYIEFLEKFEIDFDEKYIFHEITE